MNYILGAVFIFSLYAFLNKSIEGFKLKDIPVKEKIDIMGWWLFDFIVTCSALILFYKEYHSWAIGFIAFSLWNIVLVPLKVLKLMDEGRERYNSKTEEKEDVNG